jgi:putative FmdB family regulatory protein
MPIYEYRCLKCDHEFEVYAHYNSENPECEKCSSTTEKLISRFSGVVPGSENRTIDCIVGADADKRRGYLQKRKEKRKQTEGVK